MGISPTIIGAGISAGASLIGGSSASGAQVSGDNNAIAFQQQALQQQLALQKQTLAQEQAQYQQNVNIEQPFVSEGQGALQEYGNLLGVQPSAALPQMTKDANGNWVAGTAPGTPGTVGTAAPDNMLMGETGGTPTSILGGSATAPANTGAAQLAALQNTPGYQFQMQQGTQALERGAAASTGVLSTAETQALTNFGQGLAGTTYNTFMDRLSGLGSLGQNAAAGQVAAGTANSTAQSATNTNTVNAIGSEAGNVSQLQNNIGAAQASGYNNMASGVNGAVGNYELASALGASGGMSPNTGQNITWSSDVRLKENIRPVGRKNGHNLYKYNYKMDPMRKQYVGVLAQEVERTRPDAVHTDFTGAKSVNYGALGLHMEAVKHA